MDVFSVGSVLRLYITAVGLQHWLLQSQEPRGLDQTGDRIGELGRHCKVIEQEMGGRLYSDLK
jgi:hypothetical protein